MSASLGLAAHREPADEQTAGADMVVRPAPSRRAVVLLGHGSLASASGEAMFRLADRLQQLGLAPRVTAGFLNYSTPTIDESVGRCIDEGVSVVTIVPYFLVAGKFVREDVSGVLTRLQARWPSTAFELTGHLGDHPMLASLARDRAEARVGRPLGPVDAIVLLVHGSPYDDANDDVRRVVARLSTSTEVTDEFPHGGPERLPKDLGTSRQATGLRVGVGFLELNQPTIAGAIVAAIEDGATTVVAVPYFLHMGLHVKEDLPKEIDRVRPQHPDIRVLLAEHLGYDERLAAVVAARVRERDLARA